MKELPILTTEQYESIIASLQLEAINFDGDERFSNIAQLIERLAYEIPVCKIREIDNKKDFLLVGYLNTKGDIILHEPKKVVEQVKYENNPDLYLFGFYIYPKIMGENIENATTFPIPVTQCNHIEEIRIGELSMGYYKDNRVIYWEQYEISI